VRVLMRDQREQQNRQGQDEIAQDQVPGKGGGRGGISREASDAGIEVRASTSEA
jgi:hypothetical protein